MSTISNDDRKKVKGQGFLSNNDGIHFSGRIITENGTLNAKQLKNVSEAAEKFGNGTVTFTSRMTVELPGIRFEDIEPFKEYISKENMVTGGTGSRVRPVVACKGTVCTYGLFDTQGLAREIHKRFYEKYYDVALPHKFKIGVGGCPNKCIKPDLNDFGIMGQSVPDYDKDMCRGCNKCSVEEACKLKAAKKVDGKLAIDMDTCINCGLCINKCHFNAIKEEKRGLKLFIGGKWAKTTRPGTPLEGIYSIEEALDIIEKSILYYRENGLKGERFGDMIDRIGFVKVQAEILSDEILKRKEEILNASLKNVGGASC